MYLRASHCKYPTDEDFKEEGEIYLDSLTYNYSEITKKAFHGTLNFI